MTGRVAKFFPERHYGFLVCPDGELFFHERELQGQIDIGTEVEFEQGSFRGRVCAIKIRPVAAPVAFAATSTTEVNSNGCDN